MVQRLFPLAVGLGLHDVLMPQLRVVFEDSSKKPLLSTWLHALLFHLCYTVGVTDRAGSHQVSPLIVSQFIKISKSILNYKLSVTQRVSKGMKPLVIAEEGLKGGQESHGPFRTHAGGLILGVSGIVPSFATFHVENHPDHVK